MNGRVLDLNSIAEKRNKEIAAVKAQNWRLKEALQRITMVQDEPESYRIAVTALGGGV